MDQAKTSTYRTRHKTNPYASESKVNSTTIFNPDDYHLNLLCSLSARAIRVLLIIAAKHDPETGVCQCSKLDMRRLLSTSKANLSHATGELVQAELIAKGKLDTYFLNPRVFRAVHITQ